MAERWYVAQTQPGRDRTAAEHLRRQAFSVFLPVVLERDRTIPLFPGYLFVALDLRQRWETVNGTRGVTHLLPHFAERPAPVRRGYVEALQARAEAGEFDLRAAYETSLGYVRGDEVEVLSGALAEKRGTFQWQKGSRVQLLFYVLGAATKVTLDAAHLAPKATSAALR